jgi:hypothetical protein
MNRVIQEKHHGNRVTHESLAPLGDEPDHMVLASLGIDPARAEEAAAAAAGT